MQILNSLVIADDNAVQQVLEEVMSHKLEGLSLTFTTYPLRQIGEIDRQPDIVFIESKKDLTPYAVQSVILRFPRKTCVVLDDSPEENRRLFLKAGADEVMSVAQLRSDLGRHLLEKLLAFKDLAAAEVKAEQSEERFRGIIENSHDIITLLDADACVIYTSPAFARHLGYEAWEVLGQVFFDFVHEDDRHSLEYHFKKLLAAPLSEGLSMEFRFRRQDGAWRSFEAVAANLLRNEMVQAVVLNSRDVTRQRETEAELERYRRQLEELVERRTREVEEVTRRADTVIAASPDALIAMNDDGIITFISRHYRDVYPASAHLLVPGKHILEAFDVVMRELKLPESDPRYLDMHAWWKNPKGSKEFKLDNGTWLRLQAKKMQGASGTVISTTSITDYKRQQALLAAQSAELAVALEKARESVEQQKIFTSMVSHEFRTPLTIIDGNAQIIERRGETLSKEALRTRAVTIRAAVERLVRLIETILSAHMLESGRLSLKAAPCSLEKIIRDVAADQRDISPNHKIRVDIRDLPEKMTLDEKLMRQVVANLLSNAVKYAPDSPDVDVRAFTAGGEAVIEVQDRGVGVPEKEQDKIFTRYFRASTSGGIPGSGLGLSLVRQFVELHGGRVSFASREGEGTTITVCLPVGV